MLGFAFQTSRNATQHYCQALLDCAWPPAAVILKEANGKATRRTKINATLMLTCHGSRRRRMGIAHPNLTKQTEFATEASNPPTTIAHPSTWSPSSIQATFLVHIHSDLDVPGVDPWRYGRPAKHQPRIHRQSIPRRWIWISLILGACMSEAARTHDPSDDYKKLILALWLLQPAKQRNSGM